MASFYQGAQFFTCHFKSDDPRDFLTFHFFRLFFSDKNFYDILVLKMRVFPRPSHRSQQKGSGGRAVSQARGPCPRVWWGTPSASRRGPTRRPARGLSQDRGRRDLSQQVAGNQVSNSLTPISEVKWHWRNGGVFFLAGGLKGNEEGGGGAVFKRGCGLA